MSGLERVATPGTRNRVASIRVLKALREVGDRATGFVHIEDVAREAGVVNSTASMWLSGLYHGSRLIDSGWDAGERGGWKINDAGRALLDSLGM
jgi:hypothetical protein